MASTHAPRPTHLTTADCWRLLETEDLGRLALNGETSAPEIFPVNYVTYEGAVYIRTASDIKLVRIGAETVAAFEVDGGDADQRWSVVLRGPLSRVRDEVEIERAGVTGVSSWSPRYKPYVIKLTAHAVTGRRFTRKAATPSAPAAPHETPAEDSAAEVRPAAPETPGRGVRPLPIPSYQPVELPGSPSDEE